MTRALGGGLGFRDKDSGGGGGGGGFGTSPEAIKSFWTAQPAAAERLQARPGLRSMLHPLNPKP